MPSVQRGQVRKLAGGSWAYRYRDESGKRIPEGHRFEATQALKQVLRAAVEWEIIDRSPAAKIKEPRTRAAGGATVRLVGRGGGRR